MPSKRLILFVDVQNFYRGARRAFYDDLDHYTYGQIIPMELGNLICERQSPDTKVKLEQVRVYTGRPDATRQPKTYAANMRQCATWENDGVKVIPRILRYPPDWPSSKAQEKGIDVALAIDFVALAIDGYYEVGVIASTDTDLSPALEYVYHKCSNSCRVQVAAWTSANANSRLSVKGCNIWCHWLKRADYNTIADFTDYNLIIS